MASAGREGRIGQAEPEPALELGPDAEIGGEPVQEIAQPAGSHAGDHEPAEMRGDSALLIPTA